jgi:cytochrome c peroxidase
MKRPLFSLALVVGSACLAGLATTAPAGAPVPANDAAPIVTLGRLLFFDAGLSEPPGQACATCHEPGHAFTDPDSKRPTSKGVHRDRFGSRNTPSAMYMAFSTPIHFDEKEQLYLGGQFWDGRAASLEEQAKGPFLNPVEMANPDKRTVVEKVRASSRLAPRFDQLWGAGALDDVDIAYDRIAAAIAAFERSPELAPFTSKYDAYLAGKVKLSAAELRGLQLFEDEKKGNCAACHPSQRGPKGEPPLFTDFSYDNLGVPRHPDNPFYKQAKAFNGDGGRHVDLGLGAVVKKPSENGKFKVPTLRNVDLTAPYMHNGYFTSLAAVVAFYNDRDAKRRCRSQATEAEAMKRRCWPAPEVAANVNKDEMGRLGLTKREIEDIVAFMRTLTDGYEPAPPRTAR